MRLVISLLAGTLARSEIVLDPDLDDSAEKSAMFN